MNMPTEFLVKKEVDEILSVYFIGMMKMYHRDVYSRKFVDKVWQEVENNLPELQVELLILESDYVITINEWEVEHSDYV